MVDDNTAPKVNGLGDAIMLHSPLFQNTSIAVSLRQAYTYPKDI